jgi:YidC/Oxa1 family membrane protein insertase
MEKKEMPMEARLLIAFLLMGLVVIGTQYFYKPPVAPVATPAASKAADAPQAAQAPKPVPPPPVPAEMPGQVQADNEQSLTVETDLFRVTFSNRGAVARSWILKAYKDHNGKPLELVHTAALDKVPAPFSLVFKNQSPPTDPNAVLFKADQSPDRLSVSFEFSDGRAVTRKSFRFDQKSYLVAVTTEVMQNGVPLPHLVAWRGGFGDQTVQNPSAEEHTVLYDLSASKLVTKEAKDAKSGPVSMSGQYSFAGVEDKFFAGVFLPSGKSQVEMTTFADQVPGPSGAEEPRAGAAVGGDGTNTLALFLGPKDTDLLRRVDPKLEQLIDWGWWGFIAKPLFLALNWTNDHVVHNYGWAIVLVTVAINLVLFPLRLSTLKSSRKMQKLQPQIQAINAKYKNISMRDPRKAEQNQEVMELYKREGVNPMGGCVPQLIQLPFLIAFYRVLSVAIEMRGAPWLWVHDLSQPETLAIRLLPVLLVATSFLMQKMTPTPGVDPAQQKMMMFMPLMFGYIFYFFSAGLVLYYLTSNVVGIVQQWLLNRGGTPPAQVVDVKPVPKKKGRS